MSSRHHHHQSPLRKSPILSSSSSTPAKQSQETNGNHNAWALSLHVIDPLPLEICDPSEDSEPIRSARLTTPQTSKMSKELSALGFRGFTRKSPRFSPAGLTLRSGRKVESGGELESRKRCRSEGKGVGRVGKSLRLSGNGDSDVLMLTLGSRTGSGRKGKGVCGELSEKRVLRSGGRGNGVMRVEKEIGNGEIGGELSVGRRSLRSRDAVMQVEKEIGNGGIGGELSVDRSLRSRNGVMHVEKEIGIGKIGSKKVDDELSVDRSLRSRNGVMHVEKEIGNGKIGSKKVDDELSVDRRSLRSRNGVMQVDKEIGNGSIGSMEVGDEMSGDRRFLRSRNGVMRVEKEMGNGKIGSKKVGDEFSVNGRSLRPRNGVMHVEKEIGNGKIGSRKVGDELSVNGRSLRPRNGVMQVELGTGNGKTGSMSQGTVSASRGSGSGLRKSLRRNEDSGERLNFEVLETPGKSTPGVKSDEKCTRTPRKKFDYDVPEEFDDEMMSQKCLRSRKVKLGESGEKKNDGSNGNDLKDEKSVEKDRTSQKSEKKQKKVICSFVGEPIQEEEARVRWGWRYELKAKRNAQRQKVIENDDDEDKIIYNVDSHFAQARVGIVPLNIGDCVYVKGEGPKKHIGKILEFFKTVEGEDYFRVQWFYRAEDTVLQDAASFHDKRRVFYSTVTNDNILDCIISKVHIVQIPPEPCLKSSPIASAAFYYDMEYCVEYTSFRTLFTETAVNGHDSVSLNSRHSQEDPICPSPTPLAILPKIVTSKPELTLLDLYSGCGGMSTGLCLGAKLSSVNLVTKWAVDFDSSACASLKLNHPETQVRNEQAENFLELLRRWEKLCKKYVKTDLEGTPNGEFVEAEDVNQLETEDSSGEYEVSHFVNICYGDPNQSGKPGLHLLVRWKGYDDPDDDTWEPIDGLENCEERIRDFVRKGFQSKMLPLPGDVGVICGGPPCQGISGYNRYRNTESPLEDERNQQLIVYMDIVEFLKPKYVLMENVVDIIRLDKASLGRYALSRLVHMKYQARLGIIASGCYGVPQFRLRVFIWGAHPTEKLPQFPLPTHDVVVRYWPPPQFERNIVAYDEGQPRKLEKAIILGDAISDLPPVTNEETREEMAYEKVPETGFQTYIRLSKNELTGALSSSDSQTRVPILYDHRPFHLSENDYLRVCQVPHEKGANFRNLPGVIVGEDNVARRDPTKEILTLPTGALLVPDAVLTHEQGKSKRPYARLWWDETVSTIVTFPHVRAQRILHPEQDRVLTIRECARLQGFPDFYRFCGTIKDRYRQVGNAVSVPVGRALGYALGMAYQNVIGDEPLITVPPNFYAQKPSEDEMAIVVSQVN